RRRLRPGLPRHGARKRCAWATCVSRSPMPATRSSTASTGCSTSRTRTTRSSPSRVRCSVSGWPSGSIVRGRSRPSFSPAAGGARPRPSVLEATVAELYGDSRGGRPPAAVLSVQFALIDQAGARPKVVHERTIAARVDLPRASPDALVDGYGKALAEILSQLV